MFNNSINFVAKSTISLNFIDLSNPGQDSWRTKDIILKHHDDFKFQLGQTFNIATKNKEFLKTYAIY